MAEIQLSGVSMVYPNGTQALKQVWRENGSGKKRGLSINLATALKQVDLTVPDHEFIVLLGPSGCGKSTLLRLIAGLEKPSEGTLRFDGEDVSMLEPMKRNVAMVFQSFALYPHLTVYKNMAFPLKSMKLPQEEIKRRVEAAAKILDIDYLLNRRPRVLSGGQRQRVALGRAMVREPVVFLLDEPLSNLDAKMRTELRDQIIRLHERLKTTFVYVTHDQAEAMQMGDRLAIMDMGRIVQTGTPQEIYDHPNSVYVAGFVGAPKINFFASHLRRGETGWSIRLLGKTLELPAQRLPLDTAGAEDGMRVILGVRPEDFRLDTSSEPMLQAEALNVLPMGAGLHVQLRCGEVRFLIVLTNHSGVQPGDTLALRVDPWNIQVFDAQTERNLCCPVRKEDAQ